MGTKIAVALLAVALLYAFGPEARAAEPHGAKTTAGVTDADRTTAAKRRGGCICAARKTIPGATSLSVMRFAKEPFRRARKYIRRAWIKDKNPIPKRAKKIVRRHGKRLKRIKRQARDLPQKLERARKSTERAGRKLRRYAKKRFPPRRPKRRLKQIGVGCAVSATTMYLIKRARGNSELDAVFEEGGAIDGCLAGAAGALAAR